MVLPMFWEFETDGGYWDYNTSRLPEPSRIKKKKANIFIRFKWLLLILLWKFNHRKWKKCRHKSKMLKRYKESLMKGYRI